MNGSCQERCKRRMQCFSEISMHILFLCNAKFNTVIKINVLWALVFKSHWTHYLYSIIRNYVLKDFQNSQEQFEPGFHCFRTLLHSPNLVDFFLYPVYDSPAVQWPLVHFYSTRMFNSLFLVFYPPQCYSHRRVKVWCRSLKPRCRTSNVLAVRPADLAINSRTQCYQNEFYEHYPAVHWV